MNCTVIKLGMLENRQDKQTKLTIVKSILSSKLMFVWCSLAYSITWYEVYGVCNDKIIHFTLRPIKTGYCFAHCKIYTVLLEVEDS